jgi:hypothetical protein
MLPKEKRRYRPQVCMGEGQTDYKRQLAYRYLGINPVDVQCVPWFAVELRRIARLVRGVDNERTSAVPIPAIEILHRSDDPEARKVVNVYFSVPESYRRLLRPEDFCHAAGVSPSRVLGIIAAVAVEQGALASAVVAACFRPQMTMKVIERALSDEGARERSMLFKAFRYL